MEVRILGPVELSTEGQCHDLGSPKARCLLAILAMQAGRPVATDSLVSWLWDENPPPKARETLHSYITRLRRSLRHATGDGIRLTYRNHAYVLDIDAEAVDLQRFRLLVTRARTIAGNGDDHRAAELYREAASLWRGEPLAHLRGDRVDRTRTALDNECLQATLERGTIELQLGRHADLVTELPELVAQHPHEEGPVEQLMTALYRCGRQAQALETYRQAHKRITSELGTEPTARLRELHQRILNQDPHLSRALERDPGEVRPNNLPRDIPNFTGRTAETRQLLDAVASKPTDTAVAVVAIDGMAGVGKTALATRVAHQLADHYPDARLHLHLHAYGPDPAQPPVEPAAALGALLRLLGYPTERIPTTLDERAALWRAALADRRALVVLDDAASHDQVQPLLPGSPGSLVLVTSRRRLAGLGASHALSLDVLPVGDAISLFASAVGRGHDSDTGAAGEVVQRCGQLPIAIHLAASRLRHRAAWSVADLASRLAHSHDKLGEIRTGDVEIAAAFDLSYRGLDEEQQRAFRRMGLHPNIEFTAYEVAALNDTPISHSERLLEVLLDHHLAEEHAHGRFRSHDLLRHHAHDLAQREDTEADRRIAVHRLLDYYLTSADAADRLLHPHRNRMAVDVTHPPRDIPSLDGRRDAQEWLAREVMNLLDVVRYAARNGWREHATMLSHVLAEFLHYWGFWKEAADVHERAAEIWRELGSPAGEAHALLELSTMLWRLGRYEEAYRSATAALDARRALGDRRGEADVLDRIGLIHWHWGQYRELLSYAEAALAIYREIGSRKGEADALTDLAFGNCHLAAYDEAYKLFQTALEIYYAIGDPRGVAHTLNNIGDVHQQLGRHREAFENYRETRRILHEIGGRANEAVLLNNMGKAQHHFGNYDDALEKYRQSLALYRRTGDRRGEADALNNIGTTYQYMGKYEESLLHHQYALDLGRTIAEPLMQTQALRRMGDLNLSFGRHRIALGDCRAALRISRAIGDQYGIAHSLDSIGSALLPEGGLREAEPYWRQALAIFTRLEVPDAEVIENRIELFTEAKL